MEKTLNISELERQAAKIRLIVPELFQPETFFAGIASRSKKIILTDPKVGFALYENIGKKSKKWVFSFDNSISINEGNDQYPVIKNKWELRCTHIQQADLAEEIRLFEIVFIGDIDDHTRKPKHSDRILIHDYERKKSILFDFVQRKIGVSANNIGGRSLNRYKTIFPFDNMLGIGEIIRFEINDANNSVAIVFKDGNTFILPLKILYNPSIIFLDNLVLTPTKPQGPTSERQGSPSLKSIEDTGKNITIAGIQVLIKGEGSNPNIIIGNIVLTYQQLLLLYYTFKDVKPQNVIPQFVSGIKPRMINGILGEIVKNNSIVWRAAGVNDPIVLIFNECVRLGLMDPNFIYQLKESLKKFSSFKE